MRNKILVSILMLFIITSLAGNIFAAPLFPDVPENHWARDAVADLAAKGIIEGYPDGTFKGDRATRRWEMAIMLQRTLAKMTMVHSKFATKADMEALRALVNELKDELNALGVRVKNIETNVSGLDMRIRELERIQFYGYVHAMVAGMGLSGSLHDVGSRGVPVVDWTNGRILQNGSGYTALAKFGTAVRGGKNFTFGIEIVGYTSLGDQLIDQYWGVSAPYLSNPFTAQGSANPGLQPLNNSPWSRFTMDRFWFRYKPLETLLTVGSFKPEKMEKSILYGQRNPNINPPLTLPFFGIDLRGKMGRNSDLSYEVLHSKLPNASFYQTNVTAGTIMYEFKKGEVKIHYMNARNSDWGDGINQGSGGITLPNYPVSPGNAAIFWKTRNGLINSNITGPQDMNVFGINIDYNLNKNWMGYVKFASSSYDPDSTNRLYTETATGALFNLGIRADYDRVRGHLEYISVENTYDPFVLQYPGPDQGIMVFLPYSTYYFNYYQLHNYMKFPSNRQGVKVSAEYDFSEKTTAHVNYGFLEQMKASTINEFTKVGNVEPLFSYLQGGGTQKGNVQDLGLWLKHDFGKLKGKLGYNYFLQRREAPQVDSVNLKENLLYVNLQYPCSKNLDVYLNYYYVDFAGNNGLSNLGFRQHIPSLSGVLKLTKDTSVGMTYRYYDFENTEVNNADWHGGQILMEYKMKF
ncbi:MAG: S-layer homology domain-containing protein [Candidatus Eremiobacteraeota bacterium]|nr:S-layer homology domain-containing protein [Candidatus Eremiobacteraeota bacterium]